MRALRLLEFWSFFAPNKTSSIVWSFSIDHIFFIPSFSEFVCVCALIFQLLIEKQRTSFLRTWLYCAGAMPGQVLNPVIRKPRAKAKAAPPIPREPIARPQTAAKAASLKFDIRQFLKMTGLDIL